MSVTGTYAWRDGHFVKISDKARGKPDVYFKEPSFEPNLGDEKHPFGQEVRSARDKARIMKEQGIFEKGDKRHGAR